MSIIDFGGQQHRERWDRLQRLGVTEDDMSEYYNKLPIEGGEVGDEKIAYADVFATKSFSEDDQAFTKRMLDDSDPR